MNRSIYFIILSCFLYSCALQGDKKQSQTNNSVEQKEDSVDGNVEESGKIITLNSANSHLVAMNGQQQFAVDMFSKLNKENKDNLICSPLGVEVLYSILRDGAKGETYNELQKVLGISHDDASAMSKDMDRPSDSKGTIVNMANLIAVNNKFVLKHSFIAKAKNDYVSEVWSKPFTGSTLLAINKWITQKTNNLIQNGIDDLSGVMCGVNTIYFNGKWKEPFEESNTRPTVFTCLSGKKTKVMMMSQKSHFPYMKTKAFQAIILPYTTRVSKNAKMKNYSLYVFLPLPNKGFSPVKDYIRNNSIAKIKQQIQNYGENYFADSQPLVNLKLPRLEISSKIDVTALMKAFGVKTLFDSNANLSSISDAKIYVDQSLQKAVIRIDEEGTEAAAMTDGCVLVAMEGVATTRPREAFFYANRPFIYMIVCEDTNTILFVGQYTTGKIKKGNAWVIDSNIKDAAVVSYTQDNSYRDDEELNKPENTNDEDSNKIYDVVEQMPHFPGGYSMLYTYLQSHKYPADAIDKRVQGRVTVEFVVEKDGSVTNVRVMRSVHSSLDKEAIRVVSSMPRWIPGRENGKKVRVRYFVPVVFRLPETLLK